MSDESAARRPPDEPRHAPQRRRDPRIRHGHAGAEVQLLQVRKRAQRLEACKMAGFSISCENTVTTEPLRSISSM